MKVWDVVQGSSEWARIRAGVPTASAFEKIITPGGKPSRSSERYLMTLLAERLMGHPVVEHMTMWMARGSEQEQRAVKYYEFVRDQDTEPVGFVTTDDGRIGASPDRLVGADGLLEIKAPSEPVAVAYLLKSGLAYEEHKIQALGQLWVTGRHWCDLVSWHPEIPASIIRIERDDKFIRILEPAVLAFADELERLAKELEAMELGGYRAEREKSLTELLKESLIELKAGGANGH